MIFRNRFRLAFLLLLAFSILVGCGGSGTWTNTTPKITIAWPALTREIKAPAYAGSALISLQSSLSTSLLQWFVDRPISADAQSITYPGPKAIPSGPAVFRADFYSGPGGTGDLVASTAVSVIVNDHGILLNSAGGPLGTVQYGSTFSSLFIFAYEVQIGTASTIVVSGASPTGLVPIPQNLADLQISNNPQLATLTGNSLTGVAEGSLELSASYESITGTATVFVVPRATNTHRYANFIPKQIAWDSVHAKFWCTFGSGSQYSNSIVDFDPATGAVGTPIAVGSNPAEIAVSSDGTVAYVGLNGSSALRKVNLLSRTAGATTSLHFDTDPVTVTGIDVNPTNSDEVAVCVQSMSSSAFGGPFVYRSGVQVGSDPLVYTSSVAYYTSDTSLVGVQNNISSGNLYRITVGPANVDVVQTISTGSFLIGQNSVNGSKLVLSSGYVYDTSNLSLLGRLSYDQEDVFLGALDSTHNTAWALFTSNHSSNHVRIRAIDLASFSAVDSACVDLSNFGGIKRWGTKGLVVYGPDGLYLVSDAPGL